MSLPAERGPSTVFLPTTLQEINLNPRGGKSLDRNRPCISWPLHQLALHQLALHQLALQLQPLARPVIYPRPDGLTLVLGKRTLPRVLFPPASSADFVGLQFV